MHPSTKRAEKRNRLVSLSLLCCLKVKPLTKDQNAKHKSALWLKCKYN